MRNVGVKLKTLMKLTDHFSLEELTRSVTAAKKGISNAPDEVIKKHLRELAEKILEPLRVAWGSAIVVTSGYRSPKLNASVGGSKTSAHTHGYAADIRPANGDISGFKRFVMRWLKEEHIAYDQFIDEWSGGSQWVHIAVRNGKGSQRRKNLLYKGGKYSYI